MNILLDGYLDRNLGDDLMLCLAADSLRGHKIYMKEMPKLPIAARPLNGVKPDLKLTVIGSGFLLYNYKTTFLRAKELISDRERCKRAVISCNISDFPNKLAEKVIRKQLSRYDFITVRDKYSHGYIKSVLPDVQCEYYPDIVFSLPREAIAERECEGALGICAYGLADSETNAAMASIADEYIERTEKKTLIFALDTGNENDVKAAETIKNGMKHSARAEIHKYDAILKNIKRCSKFIGVRFHSIVISLLADVPVIPVSYSPKTTRMLSDIGFNEEIFELDNLNYENLKRKIFSELESFAISDEITSAAAMHIKRLTEYLEKQKKG